MRFTKALTVLVVLGLFLLGLAPLVPSTLPVQAHERYLGHDEEGHWYERELDNGHVVTVYDTQQYERPQLPELPDIGTLVRDAFCTSSFANFFGCDNTTPPDPPDDPHDHSHGHDLGVEARLDPEIMRAEFAAFPDGDGHSRAVYEPLPPPPGTGGEIKVPPSCLVRDYRGKLQWPISGSHNEDWVITNYRDLNPTAGLRDYTGATGNNAKTYDTHRGIDISVANFRNMDNNLSLIRAAMGGKIETITEDNPDRATSWPPGCSDDNNRVTVRTDNGFLMSYLHIKTDSATNVAGIAEGDDVVAGQVLAVVGSAGCSTGPHIHFQVNNCDGDVVPPFDEDLFANPPIYDTPLGVMGAVVANAQIPSTAFMKDPPPDAEVIQANVQMSIGAILGGGQPGEDFDLQIMKPDNTEFVNFNMPITAVQQKSYPRWWFTPDDTPGTWTARLKVNGITKKTVEWEVSKYAGFTKYVKHAIPASQYQNEFNHLKAAGMQPVWVDSYHVGNSIYYNVIWEKRNIAWASQFGMDGNEYNTFVNDLIDDGYCIRHADATSPGNTVWYNAVMAKDNCPLQAANHGQSAAQYQDSFDDLTDDGYYPKIVAPTITSNGDKFYLSVFEKGNVGAFFADATMTSAEYQNEYEDQDNAGKFLSYLNAYNDGLFDTAPKFSAVWQEDVDYNNFVAEHDLVGMGGFQDALDEHIGDGFTTDMVTGYGLFNTHEFAGLWVK